MKTLWAVLVAFATLAMVGCERDFFHASGTLGSEGGTLGTWRSTPNGCSRDALDGMSMDATKTVATFLWEDPLVHDSDPNLHRWTIPDRPSRLDLSQGATGMVAELVTVRVPASTRLDSRVCSVLSVDRAERPAAYTGGRPVLDGTLRVDCFVKGSRLTGTVKFKSCEF